VNVTSVKRPNWEPLPLDGVVAVEGKVFLDEPDVGLAMLRFGRRASFPQHAGETDNWVVCIEGSGFVRLNGEVSEIEAGQKVYWPAGVPHQLFTTESEMTTLMIHPGGFSPMAPA
jgi:mannose-6-phosphate isomerase-like protein (cupin superfamily)